MIRKYKKILIVNTFGIGDVLLSTPMIRTLKDHVPYASIDFMCNKRCRYLLENNTNIADIIIFEKDDFREIFKTSKLAFIKKLLGFYKTIKNKKYDLAIDLSLGYQISFILKLSGIKKRIGFNYHNRGRFLTDKLDMDGFCGRHVVEYYLDLLKLIGIENHTFRDLELPLSAETHDWADKFLATHSIKDKILMGVAPGGGKSWGKYAVYRRWDPENFSYVAKELSKKHENLFFMIFGSEEEKAISEVIECKLNNKVLNVTGKLSLTNSIALIRRCELLLCNDGGLLHIAVSQGIRTISIFGPVDDKVYGPCPRSDKHKVVNAEGVECRPCYDKFKHELCEDHDCLKKIDKEKVLAFAEASLR